MLLAALFISIPCGAIRRIGFPVILLILRISIPCGAIRSKNKDRYKGAINVFQFLVVRLEGTEGYGIVVTDDNFNSLWCD